MSEKCHLCGRGSRYELVGNCPRVCQNCIRKGKLPSRCRGCRIQCFRGLFGERLCARCKPGYLKAGLA